MSVLEKVAYLKGLAEGLYLDGETKEGKLFSAIIDTLEAMAEEIEELNDNALDIGDELDAISEDLADVEEVIFGDDECDDDCDCGCCDEDDDFEFDEEDFEVSVVCPACNNELVVDGSVLEMGQIDCPNCGETLEFEFDDDEEEDEDIVEEK